MPRTYDILPELDLELNGKPFVPDSCVYPKGQPNWFGEEEPFRAPPLLAIEIISPSQSIEQLLSRACERLSAGANAVWSVVLALQTLYAHDRAERKARRVQFGNRSRRENGH